MVSLFIYFFTIKITIKITHWKKQMLHY